jgi:hypothetical protein
VDLAELLEHIQAQPDTGNVVSSFRLFKCTKGRQMIDLNNSEDFSDEQWLDVAAWIRAVIVHGSTTVVFTKKDGTLRTLVGTTDPALLPDPILAEDTANTKPARKTNPETVTIWDLENAGWRSFNVRTVKTVTVSLLAQQAPNAP